MLGTTSGYITRYEHIQFVCYYCEYYDMKHITYKGKVYARVYDVLYVLCVGALFY